MGHDVCNSWRAGVAEDGRSAAGFDETVDQIKITTLTTGVVNRPALFIVRLMQREGAVWGMWFVMYRGGWKKFTDQ